MRYLFRGLLRETGKPVEGHVEAVDEETAYAALAEHGIVTESMRPDPKPLNLNPVADAAPEVSDAIDSALDTSSTQVSFDDLTERYRGKKVWVIDRDKIRRRVAQVVDQALTVSYREADTDTQMRQRVAEAIQSMFGDNRNIASQRSEASIAGQQVVGGGGDAAPNARLEEQIHRLEGLIRHAESVLASMSLAVRRFGRGGGETRRRVMKPFDEPPNEVLLEIFKHNLELVRGMNAAHGAGDSKQASPSPQPEPVPSASAAAPPPPPPPTPQPSAAS